MKNLGQKLRRLADELAKEGSILNISLAQGLLDLAAIADATDLVHKALDIPTPQLGPHLTKEGGVPWLAEDVDTQLPLIDHWDSDDVYYADKSWNGDPPAPRPRKGFKGRELVDDLLELHPDMDKIIALENEREKKRHEELSVYTQDKYSEWDIPYDDHWDW
jgi:hypothetical protein